MIGPTGPALLPGVPGSAAAITTPGLPSLFPGAPIANAVATLPTPPVEVLPSLAQGVATLLSPPQITLPGIPGFSVPLPKTISAPSDLLCIGTGWSATAGGAAGGQEAPAGDAPVARPEGRWTGE
jgi:hypothetical protein